MSNKLKNYIHLFSQQFFSVVKMLLTLYIRATQLILTKVKLDKFTISRGPVEILTCNDKNKTIITSKYDKYSTWIFS